MNVWTFQFDDRNDREGSLINLRLRFEGSLSGMCCARFGGPVKNKGAKRGSDQTY